MTQEYTSERARQRLAEGRCPECGDNAMIYEGGDGPLARVADSVVSLIRVSYSTLPPQTADSHVARGALYLPVAETEHDDV